MKLESRLGTQMAASTTGLSLCRKVKKVKVLSVLKRLPKNGLAKLPYIFHQNPNRTVEVKILTSNRARAL